MKIHVGCYFGSLILSLVIQTLAFAKCDVPTPKEIPNKNKNLIPSNDRVFRIAPILYEQINRVQKKVNGPVRVTSGWRSCAANSSARGVPNSTHLYGKAVDSNLEAGNAPRCKSYAKTVNSVMMPKVSMINECARSGYAPHVHLQTEYMGPCKNCGKEDKIEYGRTDEPKKPQKGTVGGFNENGDEVKGEGTSGKERKDLDNELNPDGEEKSPSKSDKPGKSNKPDKPEKTVEKDLTGTTENVEETPPPKRVPTPNSRKRTPRAKPRYLEADWRETIFTHHGGH